MVSFVSSCVLENSARFNVLTGGTSPTALLASRGLACVLEELGSKKDVSQVLVLALGYGKASHC